MTLPWRVALVLALLCGNAHAAPSCSAEETVNARVAASEARDWEALHEAFHRFCHCTAVAVAEAFSESVGRLLAARWSELYELEYLAEANREFRTFVVDHIDVTVSTTNLSRILEHVETCPGYARPICRDIESRSRYALRLKRAGEPRTK